MLVQDGLGYVHDVPDSPHYGLVYDGLGNPVGFLPALGALLPAIGGALPAIGGAISSALPAVAGALPAIAGALPGIGNILGGLFGGGSRPPAPAAPAPAPMMPAQAFAPPQVTVASPVPRPFFPGHIPVRHCEPPVGWTTPALPYTGPQPRRLYMRCSVWPGQSGLVPTAPGTWPTPQPPPGAPGAPGVPGGFVQRHHVRRRHR